MVFMSISLPGQCLCCRSVMLDSCIRPLREKHDPTCTMTSGESELQCARYEALSSYTIISLRIHRNQAHSTQWTGHDHGYIYNRPYGHCCDHLCIHPCVDLYQLVSSTWLLDRDDDLWPCATVSSVSAHTQDHWVRPYSGTPNFLLSLLWPVF